MLDSATTSIKVPIAGFMAGFLTGNDMLALFGGLMGALYAMTQMEKIGPVKRTISIIGITSVALFFTWFLADTLPALAQWAGLSAVFDIGKGRAFVAFVFGYFAQSVILPGIEGGLRSLAARFAPKP